VFDKIDILESLALLATPNLSEGGSEVEWVDDIFVRERRPAYRAGLTGDTAFSRFITNLPLPAFLRT
jgi:hypothetical protein